MSGGTACKFTFRGAAMLLFVVIVTAIHFSHVQVRIVQAQSVSGGTSCISDPEGPQITGHNQTYEYHWIREGTQLDLEVQCAGGQGSLDILWEVDELHAEDGEAFAFLSDQWGRGIHSVDSYCIDSAGYCAHQHFHIEVFDDDAFTIGFLPDTQFYTMPGAFVQGGAVGIGSPEMFNEQTAWFAENKNAIDIAWVAHLGDVVHGGTFNAQCTPPQSNPPPEICQCSEPEHPTWEQIGHCQFGRGDIAMSTLENAGIPYSIALGNHDYGPPINQGMQNWNLEIFDAYFPLSRWEATADAIEHYEEFGFFEDAGVGMEAIASNTYHLFSAGGKAFMLIAREFAPKDSEKVAEWILDLISSHPDRRVIMTSHAREDQGGSGNWWPNQWWVSTLDYPTVFLHSWGHYGCAGGGGNCFEYSQFSNTSSAHGTPVYRMGVNYQFADFGGNGYLRFLVFEPSRDLVSARTYSPYLDLNPSEEYPALHPSHHFEFPYLMSSGSVPFITAEMTGGPPGIPTVHFSAALSFSDPGVEIVEFIWDFGDGHVALGSEVSHTYDAPGEYAVELTLINSLSEEPKASRVISVPLGGNWHGDSSRDDYVDRDDLDCVIQNFGTAGSDLTGCMDVVGTGIIDEYDVLSVMCNWGRVTGDVDRDCIVDTEDLLVLYQSWGECPWPCPADISGDPLHGPDGVVGTDDYMMVLHRWHVERPGCHEPPQSDDWSAAALFLKPEWLNVDGELQASACALLNHWFGNPIYDDP